MTRDTQRPGEGGSLLPGVPGQFVKVPVEVAIIHKDLQELVLAVRDLVQVAKEINNAVVAVAGLRKGDPDGIGGTS